MDKKKIVKDFINYVCDIVEHNNTVYGHTEFSLNLINDKIAYLITDKAIEIRIKKMLLKKIGLKSDVFYELKSSPNLYNDGYLRIVL